MSQFNLPVFALIGFVITGCAPLCPNAEECSADLCTEDTAEPIEDTGADTGEIDEDPCDLTFRAYAEDGHYVDVTVGAIPLVQATGGTLEMTSESTLIGTTFEVTSKQGCGEIEVTGVQILITRNDGQSIPKVETEDNELLDLTSELNWFAPSGWYDTSYSSPSAPTIGMDWNSVWSSDDIGEFDAYILAPNDSREYLVRPNALYSVPPGEYVLTYALTWRDIETGTEVWGANLDNAEWRVTVE